MGGVIDTNILLYCANRDAWEQKPASAFLTQAVNAGGPWLITEGICYEFLRVATHPKVFDRPLTWKEAIRFLTPFWRSSRFEVLTAGDRHWRLLSEILAEIPHPSGNLFFDIRYGRFDARTRHPRNLHHRYGFSSVPRYQGRQSPPLMDQADL